MPYFTFRPLRVIRAALFVLVALSCNMASAGWVHSGQGNFYYWQDSNGVYDGWHYLRGHSGYVKHSRYQVSAPAASYGNWRDRVTALLVDRAARRIKVAEAAAEHQAFLETMKSLQLIEGGYGGNYDLQGQQTIYGQVTAPLGDAFRNFDVEARLAGLQRLEEQAATGHIQMAAETRATLRAAIKAYEHLKVKEIVRDGAEGVVREYGEAIKHAKPAEGEPLPKDSPAAAGPVGALNVPAIAKRSCIDCHGAGKAERGLRLDTFTVRGAPIDARYWDEVLLKRIIPDDPKDQMPPPGSGRPLTFIEKMVWVDNPPGAEEAPKEAAKKE